MKNIITLVLFCLFHCSISIAQTNCTQDSIMYLAAYNYIVNDSVNQGKAISVSDSIVDLDRFWFSEDLKKFPVKKNKVDQYRINKGFIWFETYYSYCIDSLFCKKQKANNILFFSQIEDNMLRADVLLKKRCVDKFDYDTLAFQTVGRSYLFIFDEEGSIKMAFSRELIYD